MLRGRNEMEMRGNHNGAQAVLASGSILEAPESITQPGRENPLGIGRVFVRLTACFLLRYDIENYLIPALASCHHPHLPGQLGGVVLELGVPLNFLTAYIAVKEMACVLMCLRFNQQITPPAPMMIYPDLHSLNTEQRGAPVTLKQLSHYELEWMQNQ